MDGKTTGRFLTVKIPDEDFRKYKAYLQYIAKTRIQEDIREYVRSRGKLVDEKIEELNNFFRAHVNKKCAGKGRQE